LEHGYNYNKKCVIIRGMKVITDEVKIDEILSRGVHEIFTREELKKKLLSGKSLHIKLGTDVTGSELHLGHAVIHRKLRDFQELGHRVTLIIGDFTTLVGDHSDKIDQRADTTPRDIKNFEKKYEEQFFKTVIKKQTKVEHNAKWLRKLNFNDIIGLAQQFTISQMLDRKTFADRYKAGNPIELDEFLYPLMQGYDSVALRCDLELGGTDQTFNLLAGRKIMPSFGLPPQSALVMKLLVGSDGKPMGKSLKNFIPILNGAAEMYGQIMSVVDEVIWDYFELITRVPLAEIEIMKQKVSAGENPMIFKKKLAREIVMFYHGEAKAEEAEKNFQNVFQDGGLPEGVIQITNNSQTLEDILLQTRIVSSRTESKRLFAEGAITNLETKEKITDPKMIPNNGQSFRIGQKRFIKIN